ncbi:MAG: DUF4129 domain-containing protein [Gammaproteobacteria bacterium]|nr:DUF4129 domain-containing protein [Gammaproteobacteria bacterium]
MNLDKIQVNACLRSGWQAIDLGFLMARAWYRPLFLAGAIPALICFVPLLILFLEDPFWAGFCAWWLKPFFERVPLYVASRKLFEDEPSYGDILARARRLFTFDMLPLLLWRRLSVQRAFNAPVSVLEELKGSARAKRLRVLHGKYSDVAMSNQFVCFCFEMIFTIGLVLMFLFFTPERFFIEVYDSYDELTLAGEWIYTLAALIAMTLIMPFHSMAGFSLYLNRRIELEAWDIEINFRSLANRKQRAGGLAAWPLALGLALCLGLGAPAGVDAATTHDRESARELIEEVLRGADYGQQKTVSKWRFKEWEDEDEGDETIPEWLIEFIEWLLRNGNWSDGAGNLALWLKFMLIAVFVLLAIYLLKRYQGPLGSLVRRERRQAAPEVLFGLEVTPESLPEDVTAEVRRLWLDQAYREAIGLLYRASLSRLIDRHELAFRDSHTEAECAALVSERGIESLSTFFDELTRVWRRLAYGHQLPPGEVIDDLCRGWQRELSDAVD